MPLHIVDSRLYGNDFSGPEIRKIWEEASVVQDWLDFEVALAEVQAELGIIPAAAAREIKAKGTLDHVKLDRIAEVYSQTMLSSVAMIRAFKEVCDGGAGEYIHYGATTQDLFDSTLAVRLGRTLDVFERDLGECREALNKLADAHRATVMAGHTHGQQALPVTFGFMAAVWSEMIAGHLERLREARPRILVGTVSGAMGNLASFTLLAGAETAWEMQARVLARLGLSVPRISVQPRIERLTEFMSLLGLMTVSFEKIASEIFLFQRVEFSQLEEPFDTEHQISSSTMPQKRNPNRSELIKALAKKIRSNANAFSELYMVDFRDHAPFYLEDLVIPETVLLADTMLKQAKYILSGLDVNKESMRRNLNLTGGLIMSEPLMLALAQRMGKKETAMRIVHKAAMEAFEKGVQFSAYAAELPEIRAHLSADEVRSILAPEDYLGLNDFLIDRVIGTAAGGEQRKRSPLR